MSKNTLAFSRSPGKPYAVTLEANGKKPLVRLKEQHASRMFDPTTNLCVLLASEAPTQVGHSVALVMLGEAVLCTVNLAVGGSYRYEFSDFARFQCQVTDDVRLNLLEAQVCALVSEAIVERDNYNPRDFAGTIPLVIDGDALSVGNKSLTA